jgi:peptide/nickel transport system substrate-binding protein
MRRCASRWFLVVMVVTGLARAATAQRPPEGTLTLGMPFTLTPALLNPAETTGRTASIFHYALHDALLKPLPGQPRALALAESWAESPDGRPYEFTRRQGLTFHDGDPFTAGDVKFSVGRSKGVFAALLPEKVQAVEVLDPHHVRFVLHTPWPDFLTVYAALVSGAGWIMPKAYTEGVGEAGFQQHPIGLGPYRFVRATAGTELVLAAPDRYWRKVPTAPRLVFKSVPDPTTQRAMLTTGNWTSPTTWAVTKPPRSPAIPRCGCGTPWEASPRGWSSSGSGIPPRPGMTAGCGWPPTWRSTSRP